MTEGQVLHRALQVKNQGVKLLERHHLQGETNNFYITVYVRTVNVTNSCVQWRSQKL